MWRSDYLSLDVVPGTLCFLQSFIYSWLDYLPKTEDRVKSLVGAVNQSRHLPVAAAAAMLRKVPFYGGFLKLTRLKFWHEGCFIERMGRSP